MGNLLNEEDEIIRNEGRDINVIAKQLPVNTDTIDYAIIYGTSITGILIIICSFIVQNYILIVIGAILLAMVIINYKNAESFFNQLEQKIQQQASQLDNYLENRVIVLQNTAKLVEKAVNLDKEVFTNIAQLRSGNSLERNEISDNIEKASQQINLAFENYPSLQSHEEIRDAMQQNLYLQKEVTASRDLYNDVVYMWNREVFQWPFKRFIAAKRGYTTRIPFIASQETKQKAREILF